MPKIEMPEGYINQTSIKQRGWTQGLIDQMFGEPDILMEYKNVQGYKMKLYKLETVVAYEVGKRQFEESFSLKRNTNAPRLLKMGLDSADYRLKAITTPQTDNPPPLT